MLASMTINNSNTKCGAVIVNQYQNQQWVKLDCEQKFPNISFICEKSIFENSDDYFEENILVQTSCRKRYILYDGYCISFEYMTRELSKYRPYKALGSQTYNSYKLLEMYLTKWSLRKTLVVNIDPCNKFIVDEINYPNVKQWRKLKECLKFPVSTGYVLNAKEMPTNAQLDNIFRYFKCKNGAYILSQYMCDDWNDCSDDSDEYGCMAKCQVANCSCDMSQFKCKSEDFCISYNLLCDGAQDCNDGSDEQLCQQVLPFIYSTDIKISLCIWDLSGCHSI